MNNSAIRLKDLKIHPPLLLAPMAGLTHSVLRRIILGFGGVGLLTTEMLSAIRLPKENQQVSPFLFRTPEEIPLAHQLLISRDEDVEPAVTTLHRVKADVIDLNLGCPAPTVRRLGAGSKLMEAPDKVRHLVASVRRQTQLPLTAKIRLGEELNEERLKNFCLMLAGEGVELITVHARLRKEPYCRKPRWEWVAKVKKWLDIPVIANGGIFSVADAKKCLEVSGADGLMIGRGAAVRPWIFAEIANQVYGCDVPQPEVNKPKVYFRFIELLDASFLPERRLGRLKEFSHYFAENYAFGHRLASTVQSSESVAQARKHAVKFFEKNDAAALAACPEELLKNYAS